MALALSSLGHEHLHSVTLGGSSADDEAPAQADTDLFLLFSDGHSSAAIEGLRDTLQSRPLLISTLSFRQDFGLRLRVAASPENCCSFFFLEERMLRDTAHQRRGRVIWSRSDDPTLNVPQLSRRADRLARLEELTDSLLELPAALKYLDRGDQFAAELRLTRVMLGLVNYLTLDPDDYAAGTDKDFLARLHQLGLALEFTTRTHSQLSRTVAITTHLLNLIDVSALGVDRAPTYANFIAESVTHLSAAQHLCNPDT